MNGLRVVLFINCLPLLNYLFKNMYNSVITMNNFARQYISHVVSVVSGFDLHEMHVTSAESFCGKTVSHNSTLVWPYANPFTVDVQNEAINPSRPQPKLSMLRLLVWFSLLRPSY